MKLMHFPSAKNADVVFVLRSTNLEGKALEALRRDLRTLTATAAAFLELFRVPRSVEIETASLPLAA